MTRRTPPPRNVEALARECRVLHDWLTGAGAGADPQAFSAAMRAYVALLNAVRWLPRGPQYLREMGALPIERAAAVPEERSADSFTEDELFALDDPVLTRDGWILPNDALLHVEAEQARLRARGKAATRKDALKAILERVATLRNKSVQRTLADDLAKWETRLSRAATQRETVRRNAANPITDAQRKVPPEPN